MKAISHAVLCLLILLPLCVSASTKITDRNEIVFEEIPKPAHIWVYDFAVTGADVPAESALAGQQSDQSTQQTPEQIATGRKLGAEIASELIEQMHAMGLPAARPTAETKPQDNDLVIRGSLVSMVEGSEKNALPSASVPVSPR